VEKDLEKPRATERAPDPTVREDVRVAGSLVRCPYCHSELSPGKSDWVACKDCLARHHVTCWKELGRCSTCGGESSLSQSIRFLPVEIVTQLAHVSQARPLFRKLYWGIAALLVPTCVLFIYLAIKGEFDPQMPILVFWASFAYIAYGLAWFKRTAVRVDEHRDGGSS
jgi:hypothetical protein